MADEKAKPTQSLAKAPADDDMPTRPIAAIKGEVLAAAEAQAAAKSKTTPQEQAKTAETAKATSPVKAAEPVKETPIYRPGSQPSPQNMRPEEPTDSEITLVRPVPKGAVVIASTPKSEPAGIETVRLKPKPAPAEAVQPKPEQPAAKPATEPATAPAKPAPVPPKAAAPSEAPLKPLAPAPLGSATKPSAPDKTDIKDIPVDFIKPVADDVPADKAQLGASPNTSKPKAGKPDKPAKKAKKGTKRRTLVGVLIALLIIALSGATTVAVAANRYGDQAKIGATLAGVSVTGQTQQELVDTVNQMASDMSVNIDVDGQQKTFTLDQLGVTVDADKTAADVIGADSKFSWWPFRFTNYPLVMNYDETAVQQAVLDSFFGDAQHPVDSSVEMDESMSSFAAILGNDGKTVDTTPVIDAVNQMAQGADAGVVTLTSTVLPAAIQPEAAQLAVQTANNMVAQKYTFASDKKTYTLDPSETVMWITFNPNTSTGAIDIGINQDAMAEQLPGILNSKVANPPVNRRILYTPEGAQIAIETWGQSGTIVSNTDAAVSAMLQALPAAQPLKFTVTTKAKSYDTEKITVGGAYDQPNGSKWIDVNQSTYKVTLYEGTTLIKQFLCVVGAPKTPTSVGTFYINRKFASSSMRGHNLDGSEYYVAYVPYTLYFHYGEALHGAPWRSSFGYRGSHGCVNLSVANAKFVFNWAPLGTKVVSHF